MKVDPAHLFIIAQTLVSRSCIWLEWKEMNSNNMQYLDEAQRNISSRLRLWTWDDDKCAQDVGTLFSQRSWIFVSNDKVQWLMTRADRVGYCWRGDCWWWCMLMNAGWCSVPLGTHLSCSLFRLIPPPFQRVDFPSWRITLVWFQIPV